MALTARTRRAPAPSRGDGPALDAEWARVGQALRLAALAVWGGLFSLYLKVWFNPRVADGSLVQGAQRVWNGTQEAPFQYRFVVPDLIVGLSRLFGTGIGPTAKAVDAVNLALGAVLLDRLLRRLGIGEWTLPAALYGGFLGVGLLWWAKFETLPAFAVMALATTVLVGDHRRRPALLLACALVLCGMRTDLVLALGVALLARWRWADRRRIDLQLGLAIGALGVTATAVLARAFPDARYPADTDVIQLIHNVNPAIWLTALAFLAPAVLPYALCPDGPRMRAALSPHRALLVTLGALVTAEVALTFLVGRVEEVRLYVPLLAPLAVLGVLGWQAALSLRPTSPTARSTTAAD